jgi:hypothetical protein
LIARIFAETGIKDLFRNIYQLIQRYEDRKKVFYLNNKFVPIDVSRWRDNLNCTVNVGVGSGSQQTKMQTMGGIMTIIQGLIQNGGMGTMVTPQNVYNAVSEFITQSGYKNPDMFVANPANMPQPQPPQPTVEEKIANQKAQIELEKLKLEAAEVELDTKIKQQALELKKRQAKVDTMIKMEELKIKQQKLEQGEIEIALDAASKTPVSVVKD